MQRPMAIPRPKFLEFDQSLVWILILDRLGVPRFFVRTVSAAIVIALFTVPGLARDRKKIDLGSHVWKEHVVGVDGYSIQIPSSWDVSSEKDQLRATQPSHRLQLATLTAHALGVQLPLAPWTAHHKKESLGRNYPGYRIVKEELTTCGSYPAVFLHIAEPGGDLAGFDLFQALVRTDEGGVVMTLSVESGNGRWAEAMFRSIAGLPGSKAKNLGTKRSGGSGTHSPSEEGRAPSRTRRISGIQWIGDYERAFEEARRRRVPVMIVFNHDSQAVCEAIVESHYGDKEVIRLSRHFVCIVGSLNAHGRDMDGDSDCTWFPGIRCRDHRRVERTARRVYLKSRDIIVPQHLFCDPGGELLSRREFMLSVQELKVMMREAIRAVRSRNNVDDGASLPVLAGFLHQKDSYARRLLVSDLFGDRPEEAAKLLGELRERGNGSELVDFLRGVSMSSSLGGLSIVLPLLGHRSSEVRLQCVATLERLGDPRAVSSLQARLRRETRGEIKKELVFALGSCGRNGDRSAVTKDLLRYTRSGTADQRVAAVVALRSFSDRPGVVPRLLNLLETSRSVEIQAASAWTLGYLEEPKAAPILKKIVGRKKTSRASVFMSAMNRLAGKKTSLEEYELYLESLRAK